MTVPVQDPVTLHTGNGIATVYAYQFLLKLAGDLVVKVGGVTKTLNVDYTISGLGVEAGGDVTFVVAPPLGASIILQRVIALVRTTDYQYAGDFNSNVVNPDFDRLWMALQGAFEALSRTVQVPVDSTVDPQDLIDDLEAASATAVAAAAAADASEAAAALSQAAAAASAASINLPSLLGKALNMLRVKADETGYEMRTPSQVRGDIAAAASGTNNDITSLAALIAPAFRAYSGSNQGITNNVETKVTLALETYDTNNYFDAATNSRFQPLKAGYYRISGLVRFSAAGAVGIVYATIYKNGASYSRGQEFINVNQASGAVSVDDEIFFNGSTDYVELWGLVNGTTPIFQALTAAVTSRLTGSFIRST